MSRLMSVALTEQAVVEHRKTVTRRLNWWETKNGRRILLAGDQLTLCRKVMGRKAGEPLIRIVEVDVVDVRRERLDAITDTEVEREGFPGHNAAWFVDFFTEAMKCRPDTEVTRIEWRYLTAWHRAANKAWEARRSGRLSEDDAAQAIMSATVATGVCLRVHVACDLARGAVRPSVRLAAAPVAAPTGGED